MSATRVWRVLIVAVVVAWSISPVYANIVGFREYHGKRAMCVYSGNLGPVKDWRLTTNYERVFTGTVKSVTAVGDFEKRVELEPDEVFLGDAKEVTAITNQACLDTDIEAGQKWLVYLFRAHTNNELVLGYEGRSKPMERAQNDIAILRHLSTLTDSGILTGHVGQAGHIGQAGHKVVARRFSDSREFSAVTDASGNYELELPTGKYFATANTTQGLWAPETEVSVLKHDCVQVDFSLRTDGRIAGTVTTADGKPASYVQVAIVRLLPVKQSFTVTTDGLGHFEVGGREPGQYLVGVGILDSAASAEPKIRVYYPGVPTLEQAHVVELGKGEWRTDISFMLPTNSNGP